jgi:hypothetical protein
MIPLKAMTLVGGVPIIGVADWLMMKVTGTICVPAVELKTIEPLYVPGFKPVIFTPMVG